MHVRTWTFVAAALGVALCHPALAADRSMAANGSATAVVQKLKDATVKDLLAELDRWMRDHRADLHGKLNPPATDAQLRELEAEAGGRLPEDFKALLRWRNGQPNDVLATFHPLTNEMFVSSSAMIASMREMKELARFGDIEADSWSAAWIPFMDNGGGNYSCLDLKTGAIVLRDHETQEIDRTHASLREWLQELVAELSTNRFAEWDFKESRPP